MQVIGTDFDAVLRLRPSKAPTCKHELCRLMYRKIVSFQEPSEVRREVQVGGVRVISDKELAQRCKRLGLDAWVPSQFSLQETLIRKRPHYVARRIPLSDSE